MSRIIADPSFAPPIWWRIFQTPWGKAVLVASPDGVRSLWLRAVSVWASERKLRLLYPHVDYEKNLCQALIRKLAKYFEGEHVKFDEPLDLSWASPFERNVYRRLRDIPCGGVVSYKELARRAGCPSAARAVGRALARNQIPILIPCHRVIYQNGSLGHYSEGTRLKKLLLRMERFH